MSAITITTLTQAWFDLKPPAITVSSLTNRPNGGRPLTATAARPNNNAVTGMVRTNPQPICRNSSVWNCWWTLPAAKNSTGLVSAW